MGKFRWAVKLAGDVKPIVRNAAIGTAAGAVGGFSASDAHGADAGFHRGAKAGALVGAISGLPFGKLARKGQLMSRTYAMGLKATNPSSKTAKALNTADRAYTKGRVMFRRVRGRIIPIAVK